MKIRTTLLTGITLAGAGVVIGAFGAHSLKEILTRYSRQETFELAVKYQFYHAFALIVTGVLMNSFSSARLRYAAVCFVLGIVLFSGSLYILSLTGRTLWGAVTPVGGVFFIAGWIFLLAGVYKK